MRLTPVTASPKLEELGITKRESAEAQMLAKLPKATQEAVKGETRLAWSEIPRIAKLGIRPPQSELEPENAESRAVFEAQVRQATGAVDYDAGFRLLAQAAVASGADAIMGRMGKEDREVRQVEWLTEPELATFLSVAREREPRYFPFLLTLASTGMRAGEALGLQVGDVDLNRCRLAIRRAIRKHRVSSPKSGKPRTVDSPPSSMAVLRGWIDTVRAEAAVRGQEATWLFPSGTGQPMDEVPFRAAFRRCLKAAGILRHLRPHDLRHTYASLALQRGVPLVVVSRQLGHASIAITADIYGHLAPDAGRQAADAMEAILTEHSRNPRATPSEESA